jgi:hypothetical protein
MQWYALVVKLLAKLDSKYEVTLYTETMQWVFQALLGLPEYLVGYVYKERGVRKIDLN